MKYTFSYLFRMLRVDEDCLRCGKLSKFHSYSRKAFRTIIMPDYADFTTLVLISNPYVSRSILRAMYLFVNATTAVCAAESPRRTRRIQKKSEINSIRVKLLVFRMPRFMSENYLELSIVNFLINCCDQKMHIIRKFEKSEKIRQII